MRWSRFLRRNRWDEERACELDAYLEIETEENIARGMSVEEALPHCDSFDDIARAIREKHVR